MVKCQNRAKRDSLNELALFWRAFRWMEEKSIFPAPGSLCDQSNEFISACDFMKAYSSTAQRMKEKAAKKISGIKKRGRK